MATANPNPTPEPIEDPSGTFTQPPDPKAKTPAAKKDDAPARVKVQLGDKEIETDETSAAALQSLLQANAQMAEFIQKGFKTPGKPDPAPKKEEFDYETALFTDPKGAIARLRAEIKQEVIGEVTAAYSAAESKKDFWSAFYTDNADLKSEKMIVDAVMARDWTKLKDLSPAEAGKKLAEAAKKELMRLSGGTSKADPDARPIEGSGNNKNSAPNSKTTDPNEVTSLSDVIRRRKEARAKASALPISKE